MELDSDSSEDVETTAEAESQKQANIAKKILYRSIRIRQENVRYALNAAHPDAMAGRLVWKQVPSNMRALIHETVLKEEPYLEQFLGGWITEDIMKDLLHNERDTTTRTSKHTGISRLSTRAGRVPDINPAPIDPAPVETPGLRIDIPRRATREPEGATDGPVAQQVVAKKVPPSEHDEDDDDDNWGEQVDAELTSLARSPQKNQRQHDHHTFPLGRPLGIQYTGRFLHLVQRKRSHESQTSPRGAASARVRRRTRDLGCGCERREVSSEIGYGGHEGIRQGRVNGKRHNKHQGSTEEAQGSLKVTYPSQDL
ncbi:hypothetical protein FRC10_005038 [Ceratobasidium sp. 414]|nr:hypothetical protein FRC10_005038 [Ceratobasidium sp. 414]